MVSQLSNHIKLCSLIFLLGVLLMILAFVVLAGSGICWECLFVLLRIWKQMLPEPSEVCDFGRTRVSFHESNERPRFTALTSGWNAQYWRCREECVASPNGLLGQWTKEERVPMRADRDGYVPSAELNSCFWWERKTMFCFWWRTAENIMTWKEEDGRGWRGKRGCLSYTTERNTAPARDCVPDDLCLTRIYFHGRGGKQGRIQKCLYIILCKNKKYKQTKSNNNKKTPPKLKTSQVSVQFVTSHPSHSQAPEKSSFWYSFREAVQIHSPRSKNDQEVGWTLECILKSWWIY